MYDSAFITQFPTLYKNTQERHVSGRETWEIGSVLEGGGEGKKKKNWRWRRGVWLGRTWEGKGWRVSPPPHILPRKRGLINWAIQTHNYITFLNNRHFLLEVLLFHRPPPPLNPDHSNETVLRSKLADNVALLFFFFPLLLFFCFTFFLSPSHWANSTKSKV